MALFGRLLRLVIFFLGIALGAVATLFAVGNQESIKVTLWTYDYHVQVYALALVPLAIGLAFGWLYTLPARTHEFADHWRSWRTVRRMEKENSQLRRSLDRVLELPDEASPSRSGAGDHVAVEVERPSAVDEPRRNGHVEAAAERPGAADLPVELAELEPLAQVEPAPAATHRHVAHASARHAAEGEAPDDDGPKPAPAHRAARRPRHEPKPAAR